MCRSVFDNNALRLQQGCGINVHVQLRLAAELVVFFAQNHPFYI